MLLVTATQPLTQPRVVVLQVEDHRHAGKVEAVLEQRQDPSDPVEVVVAVTARPAVGAAGVDQAAAFVDTEVLHGGARQLGRHRDRVDPPPARLHLGAPPSALFGTCTDSLVELYKTCNSQYRVLATPTC